MVDWSPGLHSREEFEKRRDSCTKTELNKLLASNEFARWQHCKVKAQSKPLTSFKYGSAIVIAMVTCVFLLLGSLLLYPRKDMRRAYEEKPFEESSLHIAENDASCPSLQVQLEERADLQHELQLRVSEVQRLRFELEEALGRSSFAARGLQATDGLRSTTVNSYNEITDSCPDVLEGVGSSSYSIFRPEMDLTIVPATNLPMQPRLQQAESAETRLIMNTSDSTDMLSLSFERTSKQDTSLKMAWFLFQICFPYIICDAVIWLLALYYRATGDVKKLIHHFKYLQEYVDCLTLKLKESEFTKENAEQSQLMLEQELQRQLHQIEAMQRRTHSASPLSLTSDPTSPFSPFTSHYTPSRGELPPPPACLIEQYLKDRNAVAVEETQVQKWLLMESDIAVLRHELAVLQEQKMKDASQQQLLSQKLQLARVRSNERNLLKQNLELVVQLKDITVAFGNVQAQLFKTQNQLVAYETQHIQEETQMGSMPSRNSDAEYGCDIESTLDLMRSTRTELAQRLSKSQEVYDKAMSGLSQMPPHADCTDMLKRSSAILHSPPGSLDGSRSEDQEIASMENKPLTSRNVPNIFGQNGSNTTTLPCKRTPQKTLWQEGFNENHAPGAAGNGYTGEGSLRQTREAAKQQGKRRMNEQ